MVTLYEYVDIYPTWAYNIAIICSLIAIFIIFIYIIYNAIKGSIGEFSFVLTAAIVAALVYILFINPYFLFGHKFLIIERNSMEDLAEIIKEYNIVEIKDNIVVLVRKTLGG